MVEDNGTKKSGPKLGKKVKLEKKIKETWRNHCKENDKYASPLPFPTTLQK